MSDMILEKRSTEKAMLAKLLARENLRVEIRRAPTAYFDLETRILVVPQMKDTVSEVIYTAYIAHEIGHALHTDKEDWRSVIKDDKVPHYLINLVEDARIEKLIKDEYPGTKSMFYRSYRELLTQGFFGLKTADELNTLGLFDRFNTHFKLGKGFGIKFTDKELPFIEKGYQLETWQDAKDLAIELRDYLKANPDPKPPKSLSDKKKEGGGGKLVSGSGGGDFYEEGEPPPIEEKEDETPLTIEAAEQLQKEMLEFLSGEVINVYAVSSDWQKRIVNYGKVFLYTDDGRLKKLNVLVKYQKFAKPYVEHMVQLFNLRKNELEYRKTSYNRTGNIDLDRIHEYAIEEDLFIRNAIQGKGQSHGLVVYFDWSSSMANNLQYSLYQLFMVTDFCRKVNIPFETYTFTSGKRSQIDTEPKYPGGLMEFPYRMVNILSSKMTDREYQRMQQILLDEKTYGTREYFGMSGTPLNEIIMAAMEMVPLFKEEHRLDNVNVCFITDGEGHNLGYYYDDDGISQLPFILSENVYIHDAKNHYVEKYTNDTPITPILLRMLANRTKTNIIGFHLASPSDLKYMPRLAAYSSDLETNKIVTVKEVEGYTNYHIIDPSLININGGSDRRLKFVLKQFMNLIT